MTLAFLLASRMAYEKRNREKVCGVCDTVFIATTWNRRYCDTCGNSNSKNEVWAQYKRDCSKKRQDEYRARIAAWKENRPCWDCGKMYRSWQLDFDHVTGTKCFDISKGAFKKWSVVEQELTKCQVVCSNCHRTRTYNRTRGL